MGEIVEMMREGYLCTQCGAALEDNYIIKKKNAKLYIVGLKVKIPHLCADCKRRIK